MVRLDWDVETGATSRWCALNGTEKPAPHLDGAPRLGQRNQRLDGVEVRRREKEKE